MILFKVSNIFHGPIVDNTWRKKGRLARAAKYKRGSPV